MDVDDPVLEEFNQRFTLDSLGLSDDDQETHRRWPGPDASGSEREEMPHMGRRGKLEAKNLEGCARREEFGEGEHVCGSYSSAYYVINSSRRTDICTGNGKFELTQC